MFYEEQVVNGILCHRDTPDGPWIPFTLEALTIAYTSLNRQLLICKADRDTYATTLREVRRLLER
jgi:hypothetical protein